VLPDLNTRPTRCCSAAFAQGLNEQLLEIWRKGQALHQWVVSGKSSFVQRHDVRMRELKDAGEHIDASVSGFHHAYFVCSV
jgi:hypothetical protein